MAWRSAFESNVRIYVRPQQSRPLAETFKGQSPLPRTCDFGIAVFHPLFRFHPEARDAVELGANIAADSACDKHRDVVDQPIRIRVFREPEGVAVRRVAKRLAVGPRPEICHGAFGSRRPEAPSCRQPNCESAASRMSSPSFTVSSTRGRGRPAEEESRNRGRIRVGVHTSSCEEMRGITPIAASSARA